MTEEVVAAPQIRDLEDVRGVSADEVTARERTGQSARVPRANPQLRYFCYAALVVVVVVFSLIRIHLRTVPLERDEGEYAYSGQLMLQGIPPYQLAYNMKLPGTYAAYAVLMAAFGQTTEGIRIGMLVVLLCNTVLIFLLTRRLFGLLAATVAVGTYTLLVNRLPTMSLDGHATHFIVLTALAGIFLLLSAIDTQKKTTLFLSGACFGLAFLMKQHGILFAVFAGLLWMWTEWRHSANWRKMAEGVGILAGGVVVPFLLTCAYIWRAGVFSQFWFWTISYAAEYEKLLKPSEGMKLLNLVLPWVPRPTVFWLMAAFGITALFWNHRARKHRAFILSFAIFSTLAVIPGLYFRPHYFLVMLPAVAILAGIGISAAHDYLEEHRFSKAIIWIPVAFFVISYCSALYGQRKYLVEMSPDAVNRAMHSGHGFPEAVVVADYVKSHTSDQDRVAIFGSEPEIYFYSGRHSATGYIYMYPLLEEQKFAVHMQNEMMREVETSKPKLLVVHDNQLTWGWLREWDANDPKMKIFNWMREYLNSNYDLVAEVPVYTAKPGDPRRYYIFQRK